MIIGLVAGVIVVGSVIFFDRIKIDDPVGAISVHLVCGIWGTLAVGIFSTNPEHSFVTQLIGVGAYGVVAFGSAHGDLRRCSRRPWASASPREKSSRASTSASTAGTPTTCRVRPAFSKP